MKHLIKLELTDAQIQQLRSVIDGLPICTHGPLICAVLPQLPFETRIPELPTPPIEEGRRFAMRAVTPKGERLLPEVARLLGRFELPHGEDL